MHSFLFQWEDVRLFFYAFSHSCVEKGRGSSKHRQKNHPSWCLYGVGLQIRQEFDQTRPWLRFRCRENSAPIQALMERLDTGGAGGRKLDIRHLQDNTRYFCWDGPRIFQEFFFLQRRKEREHLLSRSAQVDGHCNLASYSIGCSLHLGAICIFNWKRV